MENQAFIPVGAGCNARPHVHRLEMALHAADIVSELPLLWIDPPMAVEALGQGNRGR